MYIRRDLFQVVDLAQPAMISPARSVLVRAPALVLEFLVLPRTSSVHLHSRVHQEEVLHIDMPIPEQFGKTVWVKTDAYVLPSKSITALCRTVRRRQHARDTTVNPPVHARVGGFHAGNPFCPDPTPQDPDELPQSDSPVFDPSTTDGQRLGFKAMCMKWNSQPSEGLPPAVSP